LDKGTNNLIRHKWQAKVEEAKAKVKGEGWKKENVDMAPREDQGGWSNVYAAGKKTAEVVDDIAHRVSLSQPPSSCSPLSYPSHFSKTKPLLNQVYAHRGIQEALQVTWAFSKKLSEKSKVAVEEAKKNHPKWSSRLFSNG
jgi:hypothetical protein